MITLELTEEQAKRLHELLNAATQLGGLQIARHALPMEDMLVEAVNKHRESEDSDGGDILSTD